MSVTFLEALKSKHRQADQAAAKLYEENWRSTVFALAAGTRPPSEQAIQRLLDLSGRTLTDLENAVKATVERLADAALLKEGPAAEAELERLDKARVEEREKAQAAQRAYELSNRYYLAECHRLNGHLGKVRAARQRLITGCPNPEIARGYSAALDKAAAIHGRLDRERQALGVAPHVNTGVMFRIVELKQRLQANPHYESIREELRQPEQSLPEFRQRIAALEKELAEANKELAAAEQLILTP